MDNSNIVLITYIVAWLVTIIVYQKKKKTIDTGSLILFSYLIFSIFSFILYNSPYHKYEFNQIKLFPFVYLYLMLMLTLIPILKYDTLKINNLQKPSNAIIYSICILFVVMSLLTLPNIITNFKNGFLMMLQDHDVASDLYNEHLEASYSTGSGITNLPAIIINTLYEFVFLIFFYMLITPKKNKLIIYLLGFSILINFASALSSGQRGQIVGRIFLILLSYFILKQFFNYRVKKKIKIFIISLISISMVPIVILTISRFSERDGGEITSVVSYMGQQNLYFNNYGLDNGGIRYGDRTMPIFKRIIGFEDIPKNYRERRMKYSNLYIDDYVFYTYVGDFTIDFGPILAFLIFVFISILNYRVTRLNGKTIQFYKILVLYFLSNLCLRGGMQLFPYADGGNLRIISYLLFYLILRIDYSYKSKQLI